MGLRTLEVEGIEKMQRWALVSRRQIANAKVGGFPHVKLQKPKKIDACRDIPTPMTCSLATPATAATADCQGKGT